VSDVTFLQFKNVFISISDDLSSVEHIPHEKAIVLKFHDGTTVKVTGCEWITQSHAVMRVLADSDLPCESVELNEELFDVFYALGIDVSSILNRYLK
jgi:hypothetical protein